MSLAEPIGARRTPIYPLYDRHRAKIVEFHHWELPVRFSGIIEEHQTVREHAGLFDISHMGEIEIYGPGALEFIQRLTTNDASRLVDGQVQYTALCFEDGGIVDDVTLYRFAAERYLLCVNAANRAKDYNWIFKHRPEGVSVRDLSDETALLAIQGPKAEFILRPLVSVSLPSLKYYHFAEGKVGEVKAVISRTGYTGEDGFEIFVSTDNARELWRRVMAVGAPAGVKPIGLGARDTLRIEMKYALYGNDIDATTDPIEAGLGWITSRDKGDFIGREAILKRSGDGPSRKLVGFELRGRGVARPTYPILVGGQEVGSVTSGTFSPSLRKAIGLGYVPAEFSRPGTSLEIVVRGAKIPAEVVKTPFYTRGSIRTNKAE